VIENSIVHNSLSSPAVELQLEADDDAVIVRIVDDGPGIPQRDKESLRRVGHRQRRELSRNDRRNPALTGRPNLSLPTDR